MITAGVLSPPDVAVRVESFPHPDDDLCHIPLRSDGAARSARNIARWNAFLPTQCVRLMVMMGWDYTT